ncbi:unnamed protein product [Prunus armeniaca]|uniref:Uncharacterized protein n=1 Tax=Prunus armeniaca TaxID=36596 RepID=A0A6J5XRF1_PRUAR|nr:unnamed protein product [Prunus armeniaca]
MARQIYDAMQPEGVGYEVHYITTYPKYNQIILAKGGSQLKATTAELERTASALHGRTALWLECQRTEGSRKSIRNESAGYSYAKGTNIN